MNIMLVCAAGASTSIVMKKMEDYAEANGIDLKVKAYAFEEFEGVAADYDVILLGPQIGYRLDAVKAAVSQPAEVIAPMDYAMGNAQAIIAQAQRLLG